MIAFGAELEASRVARWRAKYAEVVRAMLAPRPRLSLRGWASEFRMLAGVSAEKGKYKFDQVPFLEEICETITRPDVEKVVIRKPSRVGVTEGPILNAIGYYVHQEPSSILVALPTVDDAETFSKAFLAPMIEATPVLRALMPDGRGRDSANTILRKELGGATVELIGTNSPRQVRMRGARILLGDEVDAMARSSGKEGDFLGLFGTRSDNYADRKMVLSSSPSWKGLSQIDREYADSDQRIFLLTCIRCGLMQELKWGDRETPYGMKWPADRPDQVFYLCQGGCKLYDKDKSAMYAAGYEWRALNPGNPTAGFSFNRLVSLFPGAEWPRLARRWLKVHADSERRQVFVNTVLGESYEDPGVKVSGSTLLARREEYAAEVPMGVAVLTAGVDVQQDRVEVLVNGWGAEEECWRILHTVILGDFEDDDVQEALEAVLRRTYRHESGRDLRIRCTMIDSGYRATAVYAFVKPLQRRNIFASKGDKQDPKAPIVVRARKPIDAGVKLCTIGTFNAKRHLFSSLRRLKRGPRYKHFAKVAAELEHIDAQFFAQYENEKLVTGRGHRGAETAHYEQTGPNEAIDLEVGALAALRALGPAVYERLATLADRLRPKEGAEEVAPADAAAAAAAAEAEAEAARLAGMAEEPEDAAPALREAPRSSRRPKRGGYMSGWRR